MTDEKRMLGELEVQSAIHVGDKEVLLLLNPQSAEAPYLVCYNNQIPGLGLDNPTEVVGGTDYLEAMDEFLRRAQGQVEQVRADRARSEEPQEVFGIEHCLPGSNQREERLVGRVIVVKPETYRPEYRNVANQLLYVTGGFGAEPNARGAAVFAHNVFSGEKSDCRRHQVIGILDPKHAPEWVKPGVDAIRAQIKEKYGKDAER